MTSIKRKKINEKNKNKEDKKKEDIKKEDIKKEDKKKEDDNNNKYDKKKENKNKEDKKKEDIKKEDKNKKKEDIKKENKKKENKKKVKKFESLKSEEDVFFQEIQDILKNADYDKKNLEQKIELAWLDTKKNFVNLIRQKNMYNKITLLFNKGNVSTKYDMVKYTLKNIVEISSHEHSRQFIITLAKDNKKYLVLFIRRLIEVSREIVCNRNGIYVLDEVYKMSNRRCRNEVALTILNIKESNSEEPNSEESNSEESNSEVLNNKEDDEEPNFKEDDEEPNNKEDDEEPNNKEDDEELNYKEDDEECKQITTQINKNNDFSLKLENSSLIKKISSKRLWKYELTHHILLEYLTAYPSDTRYILDLFIRNKQMHLVLQTYKGLEACLDLLNIETSSEILRILSTDFINIVNNEYGVVYILKILELNTENTNKIVDLYTENYKEIFINEVSILPLIYIFNQERKYFPTLFNQVRSRELINIDKTYLLSKYKEIISKHINIFINSFSWILVYFFSKKDEDIKKQTREIFKKEEGEIKNEYSEKLKKKMIKYKLMK